MVAALRVNRSLVLPDPQTIRQSQPEPVQMRNTSA